MSSAESSRPNDQVQPGQLTVSEQRIADAARQGVPAALADLSNLVRIPGLAWPAFDQTQIVRSAEAVRDLVAATELFDVVEIRSAMIPGTDEEGKPAVVARRAARNGAPTILLYAHHDVQPPGDAELWNSPPFEPTLRDGRLYGRGAADDKAGIMAHIGALRAMKAVHGDAIDLGVALFIEGEEEYGSRSFAQFLQENIDDLRADVIVVADSSNWDSDTPALTVTLRGNVRFTLTVRTLAHASHSGMFGGPVPDAMMAMVKLLATIWDEYGAVAIEGLDTYEGVTPPYDEETLREESGLLKGVSPVGRDSILSRIWHKPSSTVTGIGFTNIENASNTISPQAQAVISTRIAPGQSPQDAFEAIAAHFRAHVPFGAQIEFTDVDLGESFLVDTSGNAVKLARQAMADGYGRAPIDYGVGGSIPFISDFVRELPEAQILVTGVEDPHSRAHSPNESLHLETFANALTTEALLLERLNAGGLRD